MGSRRPIRPAIEERLEQAAAYLGIEGGFDGFYAFVGDLNAGLSIPPTITELGVTDPDIETLLAGTLSDPSCGGNPIAMTAEKRPVSTTRRTAPP